MEDTLESARVFIREAMTKTGLDATNLARRAKLAPSTLTRLLNGSSKTAPGFKTISKIAEIANLPMPGGIGGPAISREIKLYGYVGAGDLVFPEGSSDNHEVVEAPLWATDHTCALRVRGDSMYPAYWSGDIVFFDMDPSGETLPTQFSECVVKLKSGELYIKQVQQTSEPNKFNLVSYNAPPIMNVDIEWARAILFVDRRFRAKRH